MTDRLIEEFGKKMGTDVLKQFTALRIQNVADYFYEGSAQEFWEIKDDYPNIAPPWPFFLATYRIPTTINSEGVARPNPQAGQEVAIIGMALRMKEEHLWPKMRWALALQIHATLKEDPGFRVLGLSMITVGADGRHIEPLDALEIRAYRETYEGLREAVGWSHANQLPDSEWAHGAMTGSSIFYNEHCLEDAHSQGVAATLVGIIRHPALLALSFANCHNVAIVQEREHLNRAARRRGETPTIETWHTLKIEGMKQTLRAARNPDGSQATLKQALHICRGHFATYGTDGRGKLFGKYTGQVWKPMHTRGSADAGIRHKDYEIERPNQ